MLEVRGLCKRYPAFTLSDVSFSLQRGEIVGFIGRNGAGKTTTLKSLLGLVHPDAGDIRFFGLPFAENELSIKQRIGFVSGGVDYYSTKRIGTIANVCKRFYENWDEATYQKCLLRFNLDERKTPAQLSAGMRVKFSLALALSHGAELLILDEPTAALTDIEVEGLFAIMDKLKSEDKAVVFISHKMREVLRVSDRVTILRAGEAVCTLARSETDGAQLANLMIGRELVPSQYEKVDSCGESVVSLENVDYNKTAKHSGLNGVTLRVGKGEIVGIAGVDGNGQSELARIVTGVISPDAGKVELKGGKVARFDPHGFITSGVSHIPEDRNKQGLVGEMSVRENILLKSTGEERFSKARGMFLKRREMKDYAEQMREKYDIRCAGIEQEARSLSGGNQQKVILARELESAPDLLVAAHPTRGLDIGATRFVHDTMIEAREKGCGVLLISADFDEILEMSDRIVVMFEGQVMGEYSGKNPPIEEISLAMAGK